jgi:uncharacterized protein (DUF2141 family)
MWALSLTAALCAAPAFASDLTVTFAGVRSDKGVISAGLFRESDSWPYGKAFKEVEIPAKQGETTYIFKDLAPGRYAISYFHDENGNGKFDKNFVGMPKEGFGFSNDAKATLSAPGFEATAFTVGDGPTTITTHVDYWSSTR